MGIVDVARYIEAPRTMATLGALDMCHYMAKKMDSRVIEIKGLDVRQISDTDNAFATTCSARRLGRPIFGITRPKWSLVREGYFRHGLRRKMAFIWLCHKMTGSADGALRVNTNTRRGMRPPHETLKHGRAHAMIEARASVIAVHLPGEAEVEMMLSVMALALHSRTDQLEAGRRIFAANLDEAADGVLEASGDHLLAEALEMGDRTSNGGSDAGRHGRICPDSNRFDTFPPQ